MTHQPKTMDVFFEYVSQRKAGGTKAVAINEVQPLAQELTNGERAQLGQLIQIWEAREGKRYQPAVDEVPAEAVSDYDLEMAQVSSLANKAHTLDSPPSTLRQFSVIRPIDPVAARDPSQRQQCPNCGRMNSKRDTYCYSCGHILQLSKPETRPLEMSQGEVRPSLGSIHFDSSSYLHLIIQGTAAPITLVPREETIIGRSEQGAAFYPDVDLAPYNAASLGVSRLHALLRRQKDTIAIIDLDSKNHTYVNGRRLYPQEVCILRDGDEVCLGKLGIKVIFKCAAQ